MDRVWAELSRTEQAALTIKARAEGVPLIDRWRRLDLTVSKTWLSRARLAAELLADARSIADLGCGQMLLERCLRPHQAYIPLDFIRRDSRTIIVDFNIDAIPPVGATHFAALGLLEYHYRLESFLPALRARFEGGAISFASRRDGETETSRLRHGWVNHQSDTELNLLLVHSGFAIRRTVSWADQSLHLLG